MTGFDYGFINTVLRVFNSNDSYERDSLRTALTLDSNNVFRRNLVIEVNNDEIEVPVIARNQFEYIISSELASHRYIISDKIILPLYDNKPSQGRRTFDSIIRQMFTNVEYSERLQKVITNKGEVYYGGKGIILDENFTPLLLCTLTAKKSTATEELGSLMYYYRPVCHINPKVFLEPDRLINKGIIKKLIPIYTENSISIPRTYGLFRANNIGNRKVKVVIDNFDKFFTVPTKPTPSTCSNDILNECLVENIEDIIMLI